MESDENELARELGAFGNFKLSEDTVERLKSRGIEYLFPVQVSTFRPIYRGHNVIVKSRTGTGKTLAFCLPIVARLLGMDVKSDWPLCVILSPTRELSKQTGDTLGWLSSLRTMCVYGGATSVLMQADQIRKLRPVVLVGTPGRIKDQLERGVFGLKSVRFVVLDECDRMLDMGFKDDVESILTDAPYHSADAAPSSSSSPPQTLIFSATMPSWVLGVVGQYCEGAKTKTIDLVGSDSLQTSVGVEHVAMQCEYSEREQTIANVLRCYCGAHRQAIVFCDTKRMADALSTCKSVHLDCHVLHGDIPQEKRELVMQGFKEGRYRVLVTTDVAARGLDIPNVDLVVLTAPPTEPDMYVHRSGRTGRAGRAGICICLYKSRQRHELQQLERATNLRFKRIPAPTTTDLMKASVNDALHSISAIPDDVRNQFLQSADNILETLEPRLALASALAVISSSGNTDTNASILSGKSGFTTYHFLTSRPFQSCSVIIFFLRRAVSNQTQLDNRKDIGKILFTRDKLHAYVEVNSRLDPIFKSSWRNSPSLSMEIADCLVADELITPDELFETQAYDRDPNSSGLRRKRNDPQTRRPQNSFSGKRFRK